MEISTEDLNIIAYQFILFGRTFENKELAVKWYFLPPIGEKLGNCKVSLIHKDNSQEFVEFNIKYKADSYYIEVNQSEYKIKGFFYQTHSFPSSFELQDINGRGLSFIELK